MTKPMGVRIIAIGSFLEAAFIVIVGTRPDASPDLSTG